MNDSPLVSVNLVVFNQQDHISDAITSILTQTYANWELIVVENGSTDRTPEIIKSFLSDSRIQLHCLPEPDLVRAKNLALHHSSGEFIAILDSDDVCDRLRLEHQVRYLQNHESVGLVGSHAQEIDNVGKYHQLLKHPSNSYFIKWRLLFGTPFTASSIMFRRSLGVEFDKEVKWSEDRALYASLARSTDFHNLARALVLYRKGNNNDLTLSKRQKQKGNDKRITRICTRELLDLEFNEATIGAVVSSRRSCIRDRREALLVADYIRAARDTYCSRHLLISSERDIVNRDAKYIWLSRNRLRPNASTPACFKRSVECYLSYPALVSLPNFYRLVAHNSTQVVRTLLGRSSS